MLPGGEEGLWEEAFQGTRSKEGAFQGQRRQLLPMGARFDAP